MCQSGDATRRDAAAACHRTPPTAGSRRLGARRDTRPIAHRSAVPPQASARRAWRARLRSVAARSTPRAPRTRPALATQTAPTDDDTDSRQGSHPDPLWLTWRRASTVLVARRVCARASGLRVEPEIARARQGGAVGQQHERQHDEGAPEAVRSFAHACGVDPAASMVFGRQVVPTIRARSGLVGRH